MAADNLTLFLRPKQDDFAMSEDFEVSVPGKFTIFELQKYIELRLPHISAHRMQIRLPNGQFNPMAREKWQLKRLGLSNGNVLIVEPTLPGAWTWNPVEWYEERVLGECLEVVRNSANGISSLKELEARVQFPPIFKMSLRVFLRKWPDKIVLHTNTNTGEVHALEPQFEGQLPEFGSQPAAMGRAPLHASLDFNWDEYKNEDDTKPMHLDFVIPDKAVEVSVLCATGIMRADMFGSSDPFGVVYFNSEGVDVEVGRTSGKKNTLNPVWRDAIFTIQIPATADIVDCTLRVELFDFDAGYGDIPDEIGDFLGCVEVTGKDLVLLVDSGGTVITEYPLTQRPASAPEQDQSGICGTLTLRGAISGFECCLMSASGLVEMDDKLSKPFAVVMWNKDVLAETLPDRLELRDPVFRENFFIPAISPTDKLEEQVLEIQFWGTATGEARAAGGRGQFLGAIILTGEELVDFLTSNPPWANRRYLRVTQSKSVLLKYRKLYVTGFASLLGGKVGLTLRPGKQLQLKVQAALRLARVPQVYLTVEWNHVQVLKSGAFALELIPDPDSDPKQSKGKGNKAEAREISIVRFNLAVPVETESGEENCLNCSLRVEVVEYLKTESTSAEILGHFKLEGEELAALMDNRYATVRQVDLQPDPEKDSRRQRMARGQVVVRAGPVEGRQEHERIVVVQGCRGLAKANMMGLGSSDPFVTICINGAEVARTYTIPSTLAPMWDGQSFFIPCPREPTKANPLFNGSARGCTLDIEVWDEKDNGAKGTCLGGLYFDATTVEAFLDSAEPLDQFFPLQSRGRGTKLGPDAQISLLLPGTRFASTDEWRADVEAKLQEERRLLAEQRAEREAAELQRQEAEYMAAQKAEEERIKQAAAAAEEARVLEEQLAAQAKMLEDFRIAKQRREEMARLVMANPVEEEG